MAQALSLIFSVNSRHEKDKCPSLTNILFAFSVKHVIAASAKVLLLNKRQLIFCCVLHLRILRKHIKRGILKKVHRNDFSVWSKFSKLPTHRWGTLWQRPNSSNLKATTNGKNNRAYIPSSKMIFWH